MYQVDIALLAGSYKTCTLTGFPQANRQICIHPYHRLYAEHLHVMQSVNCGPSPAGSVNAVVQCMIHVHADAVRRNSG